jgi:hypothetical protein
MYFPLQYPRPYTSAIVFFTFPRYSTAFNAGSEIATVLIQSAKTADRINISGHTDAQVVGPRDAKIALGRALAARNFLVKTVLWQRKSTSIRKRTAGLLHQTLRRAGRLTAVPKLNFLGNIN